MTAENVSRRRVLALLGGGMGAVVLGACTRSGDEGGAPPEATANDSSSTSSGPAAGSATTTATAAGAITAQMFEGAAACRVTPEQSEGPYYIDVDKIRADIREDRQGAPLRVAARVVDVDGCTPVKDAVFEIWHCDAAGVYSGFEEGSRGAGGAPGPRRAGVSAGADETRYLRGAQVTDAEGIAAITTVYPGWYPGRTVHIHAKVFMSNTEALVTQLYFDEAVTDAVFATAPYTRRPRRDTSNASDRIYRRETTLTVSKDGAGYLGLITIGVRA